MNSTLVGSTTCVEVKDMDTTVDSTLGSTTCREIMDMDTTAVDSTCVEIKDMDTTAVDSTMESTTKPALAPQGDMIEGRSKALFEELIICLMQSSDDDLATLK